jgi:hypothetical protein
MPPFLLHHCFAMFFFHWSSSTLVLYIPFQVLVAHLFCTMFVHLFLKFSLQTWLHEQHKISHTKFSHTMMFDNSINQMIYHLIILKMLCVFPKCCMCKILHVSFHLWAWILLYNIDRAFHDKLYNMCAIVNQELLWCKHYVHFFAMCFWTSTEMKLSYNSNIDIIRGCIGMLFVWDWIKGLLSR